MDPERQPLLYAGDVRCRRIRPLTPEEVITARQEISWRRAKFCLVFMFWALMAMFLSIITYILAAHRCTPYDGALQLGIPPVHMSFTPLVAKISDAVIMKNDEYVVYTM